MQPTGVVENAKATNHLADLLKFGQSAWLDYIRRDLLTTGELKRMIEEDGLRGMTSNPAIFEKAISGGSFYDDFLKAQEAKKISTPRRAMKPWPFATFKTPPMYSCPYTRARNTGMAT